MDGNIRRAQSAQLNYLQRFHPDQTYSTHESTDTFSVVLSITHTPWNHVKDTKAFLFLHRKSTQATIQSLRERKINFLHGPKRTTKFQDNKIFRILISLHVCTHNCKQVSLWSYKTKFQNSAARLSFLTLQWLRNYINATET